MTSPWQQNLLLMDNHGLRSDNNRGLMLGDDKYVWVVLMVGSWLTSSLGMTPRKLPDDGCMATESWCNTLNDCVMYTEVQCLRGMFIFIKFYLNLNIVI